MSICTVVLEKYEASISGMTCSNCSNYLESSLKKIEFVKFANVNLVTEKALIVIDTDIIKLNKESYVNVNSSSDDQESKNNNEFTIKSQIEKLGFGVNNISKINEDEKKLNRNLNLVFKKLEINSFIKDTKNKYSKGINSNRIHNVNQLEAVEMGNIMNDTPKIELSESIFRDNSNVDNSKNDDINDMNFLQKNKRKANKNKDPMFDIETDILNKEDIDFICSIPGVVDFKLVNLYYRLEYDTTIIKGHELYSLMNEKFYKDVLRNYNKAGSEKHRNLYKITYINEFKKNTNEIYSFNPTTNLINLIIVIILLIAIMAFSMVFKSFDFAISMRRNFLFGNIDSYLFMGLVLSFTMIIIYGLKIYKKSFLAFWRSRLVNMETLIALGSISAIVLTIINLVKLIQESKENILNSLEESLKPVGMGNLNMNDNSSTHDKMDLSEMTMHSAEAAAAVLAIFIIGKFVEEKAKNNIKKLTVNMFSDEKLLLRNKIKYIKPANKSFSSLLIEKRVDVGLMEKDDFCMINSGDFLLFDCIVMKGSLEINENSNYGFDNIVKRGVGDKLKSGSQIIKVLEENTILIVTDVVEQSLLFKVIKEMSVCLNQKLKFQHFIDKIIKWFVPLIIIISVITFTIWLIVKFCLVDLKKDADEAYLKKMSYLTIAFIFERAISILVVSCPCAFGLAIPIVTTISLNKALKNGILIKNLSILPEIQNANAFVFDKTGTMTVIRRDVKTEYLKYPENQTHKNVPNEVLIQKNNLNKLEVKFDHIYFDDEKNPKIYGEELNNNGIDNCHQLAVGDEKIMNFPLYESIAILEKSQKHPIAEIMYSFAVRKIQSKQRNDIEENEDLDEKNYGSQRLTEKNLINNNQNNNFEEKTKELNNNVFLVENSLENFSSGIKAKLIWKSELNTTQKGNEFSILIGNRKFIEDVNSINIPYDINDIIEKISKNNSSIIIACINTDILGIFSVDANSIIRPELENVLKELRMNNLNDIYILSGDNVNSVEDIGRKLKIEKEKCLGNVSDFEKKTFLQSLKQNKKKVLMIGDGINDILSISEADYGISFNANSQFNLVASDIIFMKEDLNLMLILIKISKLTYIFIWINIFWAFIYNIFMIPITAGIFYSFWDYLMSPTVSSLAMLCSSLLIILTSNLLRCFIK